jgi:hypothetical protein
LIEEFVKPATTVQALQYQDTPESRMEIVQWLHGGFWVMQGENHELRRDSEYDDQFGRVLETAPPFLVIRTRNGEDRVNKSDWIVKYDEERVSVYSPMDFAYNFVAK